MGYLMSINSPDPRGVTSMSLPLKTVQCLQLAWGNSRSKPTTPLTSTETCEFQGSRCTASLLKRSASPSCDLRCIFQVLWGRRVLRVPLGLGSWLRRSHSDQEGRGWIQEDQRLLGLHPCGGSAGENQMIWNIFALEFDPVHSFCFLGGKKSNAASCSRLIARRLSCSSRRSPAVVLLTTNSPPPSCCGSRPPRPAPAPWTWAAVSPDRYTSA